VLKQQPDLKVVIEKDYVTNPKKSGYRSYHIIFEIPVYLSDQTVRIPVEVQIRTQAMDFWASLEHKVRYKYSEQIPKDVGDELGICAEKIAELDERMFQIHNSISIINGK
jgi:putative GTP pyrophosphokinase